MFKQYEARIRREAAEAFPQEAVWLITEAGCSRVPNVHADPEAYFEVAKEDTCRALAEGLLAVVHSHPSGVPAPSAADMQGQLDSGVPWGLLGTDGVGSTGIHWWGDGAPVAPLVGRTFHHGITDCYALIKDYYLLERGVTLPEYPRDWRWWEKGQDLFSEGFRAAGFRVIDQQEVREGDVWLAQIGSKVVNHGGVWLGQDLCLHQVCSGSQPIDTTRVSRREPVFRYLPYITHWLRHEG